MNSQKLSEKMIKMLRGVAAGPNQMINVPYRQGAINTAWALHERGLVTVFAVANRGRAMILTDAGRAELSQIGDVAEEERAT